MKKSVISVILLLNILIFTGCAPSYVLKPNYDKNTNILMIDSYVLKDATETIDKKRININAVVNEYKVFNTYYNICEKIAYSYSNLLNTNRYYLVSAIETIKSNYKNKCAIEQINNLNFFKCPVDLKTTSNNETSNKIVYHYGITSSMPKDGGYGVITTVYLGDKANCFNDIKSHFLNKKNSKNIKKSDIQLQSPKIDQKDLNYWYNLKVKGIITQDEFDKKKEKLLK